MERWVRDHLTRRRCTKRYRAQSGLASALNQAAPLHVVKEKCLVLFLPEVNRAAHVEAESVEPQFRHLCRSGLK